jgi:3-hydroxybutyryl-CoA dehydrogenase
MKAGIIGAGTMGSGIAQTFAACDKVEKVYLCDVSRELADGGLKKITKNLSKLVEKGKLEQNTADAVVAKILTGEMDICKDADLIVEAVRENLSTKVDVFRTLQNEVVENENCIYASNTSSLSITEIGAKVSKPILGMHFFNPAPVMSLVEIIAGINTSESDLRAAKEIAEDLGKTVVQVKEAAGFAVNRMLIPMINEAVCIYEAGVSEIVDIDNAMKLGCNHPMGPLELGDFIGLDVVLAIMDVIFEETHDSKYRACPFLRKMVKGNRLGVKTGTGFYDYSNGMREKTPVDMNSVFR